MANEPQTGDIYRHKENGNEYLFMLITNRASAKWEDRAVFSDCETGEPYDRPLSVFVDKFENTGKQSLLPLRIYSQNDVRTPTTEMCNG